MSVSIVIPNWNGIPVVEQCLASIQRHCKDIDHQVIVVDNGSSDKSCQLIQQDFPQVILIKNKHNMLFARATNQGVERAKGQYIFLLNNDVILEEGCLQALIKVLESKPSVGAVAPQLRYLNGRVQSTCRYFPTFKNLVVSGLHLDDLLSVKGWKMKDWAHDTPRMVEQPMMSALLVKRECWLDVGPLDERFPLYFNDVDWCYRAWRQGWEIFFEPSAKAVHLEAWTGKRLGMRQAYLSAQGLYRYFRKHHVDVLSPGYPVLLLLIGGLFGIWFTRRLLAPILDS